MLIRMPPTTPFQIFWQVIINFQVIVESILDPVDNFMRNSY